MGVARVRCAQCHDYFDREDAYKVMSLSRLCSEDCFSTFIEKRRKSRVRKPSTARRPKPSLDATLRKQIRKRDGNVCRYCGKRGEQIHHILYRSQGGPDHPLNLILLCEEHHRLVHSAKRTWQPLLLGVIWMGYVERRWMTIPQFAAYHFQLTQAAADV